MKANEGARGFVNNHAIKIGLVLFAAWAYWNFSGGDFDFSKGDNNILTSDK